jgi:hypothetical protein
MLETPPKGGILDYFSTEEKALTNLNPYLFKFIVKIYQKYG